MPKVPTRTIERTYDGPPRDMVRSYNTRVNGIFKKAAELHKLFDGNITVSIVIQKPSTTAWLFNTGERDIEWPVDINELTSNGAIIRRPSHYLTLNEGISRGRVQIVGSQIIHNSEKAALSDRADDLENGRRGSESVVGSPPPYNMLDHGSGRPQLFMRTMSQSPSRPVPALRPLGSRRRNASKQNHNVLD